MKSDAKQTGRAEHGAAAWHPQQCWPVPNMWALPKTDEITYTTCAGATADLLTQNKSSQAVILFFSKHSRRVCCMMDQSQAGGGEGCSQTDPGVYVKKSVTHVRSLGEAWGSTSRAVVCPELGYWDWEPSSTVDRESATGSYGLKQGYKQRTEKQKRWWALSKRPQAKSASLLRSLQLATAPVLLAV